MVSESLYYLELKKHVSKQIMEKIQELLHEENVEFNPYGYEHNYIAKSPDKNYWEKITLFIDKNLVKYEMRLPHNPFFAYKLLTKVWPLPAIYLKTGAMLKYITSKELYENFLKYKQLYSMHRRNFYIPVVFVSNRPFCIMFNIEYFAYYYETGATYFSPYNQFYEKKKLSIPAEVFAILSDTIPEFAKKFSTPIWY